MVSAFARGRPIAPLVLSAQERVYLERQVRRHRVPDRCPSAVASFCDVQTDYPASPSPLRCPKGHIVMDNYATHKTPKIKA
jgi:hypothetical protein